MDLEEKGLSQEDVKLLVTNSPGFAVHCLKELYKYQTQEEKEIEETKVDNGVGFSGADGNILTSFAKQVIRYEEEKEHKYESSLSRKQMELLVKKLQKYSKQLSRILEPVGQVE